MDWPRLLVVDDDPYLRSALHTLFARQGWQVSLAATVSESRALLDPTPCCVILDLDLPGGRGEDLLREIRARRLRTRVAVCSGLDDPSRLAVVRSLAPELLLWKPFELPPVIRLCEAAMAVPA